MSEVKHSPVWYPPQFPSQGRLPSGADQVQDNIERQRAQEQIYHDSLSVAAGRLVMPPCCKTLHITLCFDGTGNNLNNDFLIDVPKHPTNIARMFRASIGDGYVGGVGEAATAKGIVDLPGTGNGQYFKYYVPGVGTPFPEINDLDYSNFGMAFAGFGELRIAWGFMMIIDALRRTLKMPRQDNTQLLAGALAMCTPFGMEWMISNRHRKLGFNMQFAQLLEPLRIAMTQQPGQSRLLGIKLYVYGFSRGAAAARAFVSWLNELLSPSEKKPSLELNGVVLPITVEYLGLLDTVASVGLANVTEETQGHMSWADGTQQLPEGELVKRCLHLVASHEQRLCFPLDSIRRETGDYPANSMEVIYPGVHSDQGGGYQPGYQGKAVGRDDRLLLSQIALNDLYADAFTHGAPLKSPEEVLTLTLSHERWRVMDVDLVKDFAVATELINRFNAWRDVTLGLMPSTRPLPTEQAAVYEPIQASTRVEDALRDQMAWITAWRIDRYAFASLKQARFYTSATDDHADEITRSAAKAERDAKQKEIEKHRNEQLIGESTGREPKKPLRPGYKDFDPDMAQTQLREAAEEFGQHYRDGMQIPVAIHAARLWLAPSVHIYQLTAQAREERERIKAAGQARVSQLFPPPQNERNHLNDNRRGNVDESRNAAQPLGLLRALFDDQVHDSRAWFLYAFHLAKLGKGKREPFGSYLAERMVFFGDTNSRKLAVYDANDTQMVADATSQPASNAARAPQPPVMDAERLAQAQKNIDELWDAHNAKASGVSDALV